MKYYIRKHFYSLWVEHYLWGGLSCPITPLVSFSHHLFFFTLCFWSGKTRSIKTLQQVLSLCLRWGGQSLHFFGFRHFLKENTLFAISYAVFCLKKAIL